MKTKDTIQKLVEAESRPTKCHNRIEWRNAQGQIHRLDGPAVECAGGDKVWFVNGKLHRIDGPAMEWASGFNTWYVDDKRVPVNSQEEFVNYLLGIKI